MPASEAVALRNRALQLRAAGLPYQAIADQLGLRTAAQAAQYAKKALQARQGVLDDQASLFVALEIERLDGLERAAQTVLQKAARDGDHETALKALDRLTRLARQRQAIMKPPRTAPAAAAAAHEAREPEPGPVEKRVRADIAALVTAHPMGEALTEMSYKLARTLDEGAGMATAAVNRELRANLAELSRLAADDGDDLAEELSAPELPSQIRDAEEP